MESVSGADNAELNASTIITGVILEEQRFTWRIENFDVVRKSRDLIEAQRFDFNAGDTLGLLSEWSCRLRQSTKANPSLSTEDGMILARAEWIGVFIHLEKFPEGVKELTFICNFEIYKQNGDVYYSSEARRKCFKEVDKTVGWGNRFVIPTLFNLKDLPLIEGALVIRSRFRLFAAKAATLDLVTKISRFQSTSIQKLAMDLAASIQNNFYSTYTKIVTRDGQEFIVDRGFLSARSKVFQVMFQSQMQESQTGIIYMNDLSSQTILVLLHFIYTGILPDKWRHPEIIVELTYAAEKYELIELVQFLDDVLGTVCTRQTAGKLLMLTSRLSLKKAEKEIFGFIQRQTTTTEQLIAFAKDIVCGSNLAIVDYSNTKNNDLIKLDCDSD